MPQNITRVQKLALQISNALPHELSLPHKNELLKYISDNINIIIDSDNPLSKVFEIYLNNLILPNPDAVAILLSTHFHLIVNNKLSSHSAGIVFDISPIENESKRFDPHYITHVINTINLIKLNKVEFKLRACDGFRNNGEIIWFNPYLEPKEMSVKWDYNNYTVRDFQTTCDMCSMAKRAFVDYAIVVETLLTQTPSSKAG